MPLESRTLSIGAETEIIEARILYELKYGDYRAMVSFAYRKIGFEVKVHIEGLGSAESWFNSTDGPDMDDVKEYVAMAIENLKHPFPFGFVTPKDKR